MDSEQTNKEYRIMKGVRQKNKITANKQQIKEAVKDRTKEPQTLNAKPQILTFAHV